MRPVFYLFLFIAILTCKVGQIAGGFKRYSSKDYIEQGTPGINQAITYRIALSPAGRNLLEDAVRAQRHKEHDRAIALLKQLTELEPASVCAREQLGRAYMLAGNYQEAQDVFIAARKMNHGNAYLRQALDRWLRWAQDRKPVLSEGIMEQLFAGLEIHMMENRLRPATERPFDTPHLVADGQRFAITLPANLLFELLSAADDGILLMGSSRVREGVRAGLIYNQLEKKWNRTGPVFNFGYSASNTDFWVDLVRAIEETRSGKPQLRGAVLFIDYETMSSYGIMGLRRRFSAPAPLVGAQWSSFVSGGLQSATEIWPVWARSNFMGSWSQTSRWADLIRNPVSSGANPVTYLGRYAPENDKLIELEETLRALKRLARKVILIENPVPSFFATAYSGGQTSARPYAQTVAQNNGLSYFHRSLDEWGLNDGHFFGSRNYPIHKIDWFHLNFNGAEIWSQALADLIARELK